MNATQDNPAPSTVRSSSRTYRNPPTTRWTKYTAWIWTALSISALLIFLYTSYGQIDPRIALLILTLSSSYVIVAHSYRRFLVGNGDSPADYRENEIQVFANSPRAGIPANRKEDVAETLRAGYDSEYSIRAYTICVIPAVAMALIGWTLVLVPLGQTPLRPNNANGEQRPVAPLADNRLPDETDKGVGATTDPGDPASGGVNPSNGNDRSDDLAEPAVANPAEDKAGSLGPATPQAALLPENAASQGNESENRAFLGKLEPLVGQAMGIGFLGATVFCFQLLWQRLTTEDLKPSVFLRCAMAMFLGLVFAYVVFAATKSFASDFGAQQTTMTGTEALVGYVVAFSLGYFPMLAINWFTRIANASLGEPSRRSDTQRLLAVDGITVFHEDRLLEEGIHNLHDLAFADVKRLLIRTPYTARQLLDWVDQSLLLLHLDAGEPESFRRGGIRNAENLLRIWEPLLSDPADKRREEYALMLQTTPQRLDCVYLAIKGAV